MLFNFKRKKEAHVVKADDLDVDNRPIMSQTVGVYSGAKRQLIITRKSSVVGGIGKINVSVNGAEIGSLANGETHFFEVASTKLQVVVSGKAKNGFAQIFIEEGKDSVKLTVGFKGSNVYVQQA